jgi:cellobiose dehydrogenase (acceptor)
MARIWRFLLVCSLAGAHAQENATPQSSNNQTVPTLNSTYDYIVVGGGPSGLIVSERLAETGKSVLVLERGAPSLFSSGGNVLTPWNNTLTYFDVPALHMFLGMPGIDARCTDVPTGAAAGCLLGGGTAINGMQFVHPPTFDFDDKWPEGWRWDDVKHAAARLYERNPGTLTPSANGKLYDNDVRDVVSKFFALGGYTEVDTNEEPDRKHKVWSYPALSTQQGFRAGPVRTYLPLAEKLPNFKLQLYTKVIRAVRAGPLVTGIEVESATGQRSIINLNKGGKVILAAGAMSSPRLLFNTGIGPLEQIEIVHNGTTNVTLPPREEWVESPVGFVRDHTIVIVTFNVPGGTDVLNQTEFLDPSKELRELYAHGSGPLAQAWNRLMSYTTVTNDDGHKTFIQTHVTGLVNGTAQFLVATTHNSTSTGTLGITADGNTTWTKNPYLNSASDREAMTKALDELLAISRLPGSPLSYSAANATGASVLQVALSQQDPKNIMIPGQHMIGTTIMGTDDGTKNGSSVIDTDCKVYGTGEL